MTTPLSADYEKLGVFYLGRVFDSARGEPTDTPVLYDSKDLTTHAVCVGMTGSGKTGLCITLLEEAAIDGVPALVIDPKGDMGNLLLNFPGLAPADFQPWIDPADAARKGQTVEELARATAELWRKGLEDSGQDGARVARLAQAAELALYTPGSDAGRPLSVLRSFDAPPPEIAADREALAERIQAAVTGLLALVGVSGDALKSREAILVSNLLQAAWAAGKSLALPDLIRGVQSPPFERLGVFDLESFYPAAERMQLALALNGVLASPSFAAWLTGEPLDVDRLLFAPSGKPRIAVLSIAHLAEAERMFFVTILLNEVVAWMRRQPGTGSLRAVLYMDEIFGFFPPLGEPPSKRPMLTLLKQARAYGLGVVLATQNPVDLDYKGLANTGTWFLGRMQTERDKARVLDGLEGALTGGGRSFDRAATDALLSGLPKRTFLMNNVHEDAPVVMQTRWALSYLRGPLTRAEIRMLHARQAGAPSAPASAPPASAPFPASPTAPPPGPEAGARPLAPSGIAERFLPCGARAAHAGARLYRPAFACTAKLHYASAPLALDAWRSIGALVPLPSSDAGPDFGRAELVEGGALPELLREPEAGASFAELPAAAQRPKSYAAWAQDLKAHLYEVCELKLFRAPRFKLSSGMGESEGAFRGRVAQAARAERDLAVEKLRARYAPKVAAAEERIRKAKERIGREEEQYDQRKKESWLSAGSALLGGLFGRKLASAGNIGRASSTMKSVGRASKEKLDIERAERELEAEKEKLDALEQELAAELTDQSEPVRAEELELEVETLRPKKADLALGEPLLLWIPYTRGADGTVERA